MKRVVGTLGGGVIAGFLAAQLHPDLVLPLGIAGAVSGAILTRRGGGGGGPGDFSDT